MKFKKRIVPKPSLKTSNIIEKLLKQPIRYEKFLELLEDANDTFFDNPELEFELLIANGLPLDFHGDDIYLKTTKTNIDDEIFCIVDIETNGSSVKKGFQIIELGAVKYQNGQIIDKFESLVYAKDIAPYIQEVTNINPSMLENAPVIESVLKEFKLFLEDSVFIAHDIKFDYSFISDSLEKYDFGKLENRKICTIDLAKRTIDAQRYGLGYLKDELNIKVDNHHRAYYDALATTYIFQESLSKLDTSKIKTTEDLISFSKSNNIINKKEDVKKIKNKDDKCSAKKII